MHVTLHCTAVTDSKKIITEKLVTITLAIMTISIKMHCEVWMATDAAGSMQLFLHLDRVSVERDRERVAVV